MKTYLPIVVLSLICGACASSPDAERSHLRSAIDEANALASEIITWRRSLTTPPAAEVTESVQAYQKRAHSILGVVEGASADATVGMDLAGVNQALTAIVDFDTSRVADASSEGRSSLLDQFAGFASNLDRAVERLPAKPM